MESARDRRARIIAEQAAREAAQQAARKAAPHPKAKSAGSTPRPPRQMPFNRTWRGTPGRSE